MQLPCVIMWEKSFCRDFDFFLVWSKFKVIIKNNFLSKSLCKFQVMIVQKILSKLNKEFTRSIKIDKRRHFAPVPNIVFYLPNMSSLLKVRRVSICPGSKLVCQTDSYQDAAYTENQANYKKISKLFFIIFYILGSKRQKVSNHLKNTIQPQPISCRYPFFSNFLGLHIFFVFQHNVG